MRIIRNLPKVIGLVILLASTLSRRRFFIQSFLTSPPTVLIGVAGHPSRFDRRNVSSITATDSAKTLVSLVSWQVMYTVSDSAAPGRR